MQGGAPVPVASPRRNPGPGESPACRHLRNWSPRRPPQPNERPVRGPALPRKEESALAQFLQTQPRPPAECDRPPARTRVIATARTQQSRRARRDGCIAGMMRKPGASRRRKRRAAAFPRPETPGSPRTRSSAPANAGDSFPRGAVVCTAAAKRLLRDQSSHAFETSDSGA